MLHTLILLAALLGQPYWPDHRGDMLAVPSSTAFVEIQAFTAGAGTYTWTKPSGVHFVTVLLYGSGCGGGSGGFGTSDSGGGGGTGSAFSVQTFDASMLNATESVVLGAGGIGGARVNVAGNGNPGAAGGTTSFGLLARNLMALGHPAACAGQGGTNAIGTAGAAAGGTLSPSIPGFGAAQTGQAGHDTTPGSAANMGTPGGTFGPLSGIILPPGAGGGGGGTTTGTAATNGGNGGGLQHAFIAANIFVAAPLGGVGDGVNGANGVTGGANLATTTGIATRYGGTGGGGGAGSILTNGGNGGNGGNCGGGGGGGGSSLNGALGSGKGGDGGAGCIFVISW